MNKILPLGNKNKLLLCSLNRFFVYLHAKLAKIIVGRAEVKNILDKKGENSICNRENLR